MVNYNPFEDEERSSAESYLPGKKTKKEPEAKKDIVPPGFDSQETGPPQAVKPFYSSSMDIEDRDTQPEKDKTQELLNRQMSDGFNVAIEKKDPNISPQKLEAQDFQEVEMDNFETKSEDVSKLGKDISAQNLIISNQQAEFTKLNQKLNELDDKLQTQGGKYDDLFGLIPESEKNLDEVVDLYNEKIKAYDKEVENYNQEVDRFMANPFGDIDSSGNYVRIAQLEAEGLKIDEKQKALELERTNLLNRTTASESFFKGNDPIFQKEKKIYDDLLVQRETLIGDLEKLADKLNTNIDNFKINVDTYNSKALNVGAFINQLNQAIETQEAIADRVQYIRDLEKPAEPEKEFWRIEEPKQYRNYYQDLYVPQDPESFIQRDQAEVFKDLYVPQDPESFIQTPDKLEIPNPNEKKITVGSLAQSLVDSAYKIRPGSAKGGAPELAKPEFVDKMENWATKNIYELELGTVAQKVAEELNKSVQILKGDVSAKDFLSEDFQKPEPKTDWGDVSFSPSVGTVSEFTGLPYLYREIKKVPDVLLLQLDKNPNTNISDIDDYAISIGTFGGLVDPSVNFRGKEYALSSILNPDGNENDKWRSVRQTNEFRESRPFGDIAFASKEGGDIISESEKEGKRYGDLPLFIKGAIKGDLSGWDPEYTGAWLGDQWRIADFALTALQFKYMGALIKGLGRLPKNLIKETKAISLKPDWMLDPVDLVNRKQYQAFQNYQKIGNELIKLGDDIDTITKQARYRNLMPFPFSREKYLPKGVANKLINKITDKQVKLAKSFKEKSFNSWASTYNLNNIKNEKDKAVYNLILSRKSDPVPIDNKALKEWESGLGKIENKISEAVKDDIAFNQVEILYPQLDKRAQEKLAKELKKELFGFGETIKKDGDFKPKERFIGARDFVSYNQNKEVDKLFKESWQKGKAFPAPIKGGMEDFSSKDIYGNNFDNVVNEINQLRKTDPDFGLEALEGVFKRIVADGSYKKYMSIKTKNTMFDNKGKFNTERALDWLDQEYKSGKIKRDLARKKLEAEYKVPLPKDNNLKKEEDLSKGTNIKSDISPKKEAKQVGKKSGLLSGLKINKLGGILSTKVNQKFRRGDDLKVSLVKGKGQDFGFKKPDSPLIKASTWLSNFPGAGSDSPNQGPSIVSDNLEKPPRDSEKPKKDSEKPKKDGDQPKKKKKPRDYDPLKKPRDFDGIKVKKIKKIKDPEKPKKPRKRKKPFYEGPDIPTPETLDSPVKSVKKKEKYPKVIQWKDGEEYKTINLNTNEIETREFPISGGVGPGNTPETSAKIIRRQNKKPKLLRDVGNLTIQIKGPNVVTVKQREKYLYNNNKRINLLI